MDIDLKDASRVCYELARLARLGLAGTPDWVRLERIALAHLEASEASSITGIIGPDRGRGEAGTPLNEYCLVEREGSIAVLRSVDVLDLDDLGQGELDAIEVADPAALADVEA